MRTRDNPRHLRAGLHNRVKRLWDELVRETLACRPAPEHMERDRLDYLRRRYERVRDWRSEFLRGN